ncbi:MAG: glycoside hydrolase family 3 protein, partial [Symploca sp. SIO2B6]|nr:glycoside hydrolase family 3 protein [Symploca sp. SIO2B6]
QLPPLWVATDQEGGIVSRLSPPLTHLPPLAEVVSQSSTPEEQHQQVQAYGKTHGQELAALGINLNFAPVVDLNKGIVSAQDRFSVIYRRAISDDKAIVAKVAQDYCTALFDEGVSCTLKHFPGLGRLEVDTHLTSAHLDTPIAELEQDDWVPFQQVMNTSKALTMLGHPILTAVDPDHPVSFSEAVVNGILRQQWQYDGVLITDDFSMGAVFNSRDGVTEATIKALNAGVDLILLSYDGDLYYPVMAALINAEQANRLSLERLAASGDRLQHHRPFS